MKQCFKCQAVLPLTEFYRHPQMRDGHLNKCKECNKKDSRENYHKDPAKHKAYERTRLHLPHRVQARKEYAQFIWDTNPEKVKESKRQWQQRNRKKRDAHIAAGNAIRTGRLVKQPCERCGSEDKVQAHHEDYSKPLDVMWLCPKCHGERHRELNDMGIKL